MGYFRHIIAKALPYKFFAFAVDETRAVFRILDSAENFIVADDAVDLDGERLTTTAALGSRYSGETKNKVFTVGEERLCIVAEIVIDKTVKEFRRLWVPGAHFVTWFDGTYHATVRGTTTYFDLRNTAELCRDKGGYWLFDLWVRNPDAPLTECARSITTTADSVILTNVEDLGEIWSAEEVMKGGASEWLNLAYELTPSSETVEPEGWVTFTLRVLDGKTHELANDVTWDGFIAEAVDGYCPHRRVSVVNGVGTFRVKAMDLLDGESLRVKINHRFFSGRVEAKVNVVASA